MTYPLPLAPEPAAPTAQPRRKRHLRLAVGLAAAVVVLAGAGTAAYLALGRPDTFTASGSVTVRSFKDKTCASVDGFSEGMKVVITDPAGTIVGLGALSAPMPSADPSAIGFDGQKVLLGDTLCQFQFRIANIPAKKVSYGVAIGDHHPYQATEPELRSLKLAPTS